MRSVLGKALGLACGLVLVSCSETAFKSIETLEQTPLVKLPNGVQSLGPPKVVLQVANYRFCRRLKHPEETAIYSYAAASGTSKLFFGLINIEGSFVPNDDSAKTYERLIIQAFNDPDSQVGEIPSEIKGGMTRFPAVENPVVAVKVDPEKLARLKAQASTKLKTTFLLFDDRDSNGRFSAGDRIVSSNSGINLGGIKGLTPPMGSDDGTYAFAFGTGNDSPKVYEFMTRTYLFNGAGNNCGDVDYTGGLDEVCKKKCDQTSSPLAIDLAGDGFATTSLAEGVKFDVDGTGEKQQVSWFTAGTDNAFVAVDLNGNGRIDGGQELFGTSTRLRNGLTASNGFVALADLDANSDGVIDQRDSGFNNLLLWTDTNHNGESEGQELQSLGEVVTSIKLDYKARRMMDANGNLIFADSEAKLLGLGPRQVVDIWFRTE
ncbi:MAG: hypothetical protein H6624_06160 [Bdellovibrionaceae bacterium]|nr:hypothetical protein [Bdellovibrionales bacterium]MCB9083907.1 hypothetical protein [Pseudobdellovibrionaceae bacterium]